APGLGRHRRRLARPGGRGADPRRAGRGPARVEEVMVQTKRPLEKPPLEPAYRHTGETVRTCRSCGARMFFVLTPAGKAMPVAVATGRSHFEDCPHASAWSRKK